MLMKHITFFLEDPATSSIESYDQSEKVLSWIAVHCIHVQSWMRVIVARQSASTPGIIMLKDVDVPELSSWVWVCLMDMW